MEIIFGQTLSKVLGLKLNIRFMNLDEFSPEVEDECRLELLLYQNVFICLFNHHFDHHDPSLVANVSFS